MTESLYESQGEPPVADLEREATFAYLRGADEETEALWISAHNEYLQQGKPAHAARCISWLVLDLFNRREWARANGWLARGLSLVEPVGECASLGLLRVLASRNYLRESDVEAASREATAAVALARQFDDPDLNVLSRMALALVHTRRGQARDATTLFDEIMIGVTVDRVSPIAVGVVYCAVIDACRSLFDISRAREWTFALDQWCSARPAMVPFRGKCLVHRSEILRLSGAWPRALAEAEQACAWSGGHTNSFRYPAGAAYYELAELSRLRGDVEEATDAYRRASEHGQSPEPGLTLLQFGLGKQDVAAAAMRRILGERQSSVVRAEVLLAAVEILTTIGDLTMARVATDELAGMWEQLRAPALQALAAHASGTLRLAEGDVTGALRRLREAWMLWQELEIPYQAARVRVLLGLACQQSGDDTAAQFEFDGAREFFQRVSAQPDLERIARVERTGSRGRQVLSARELQVIELLASGRTNREIARGLSISERTVDRHVSNILRKLNVPSRSAATAYAFQHDLVSRSG